MRQIKRTTANIVRGRSGEGEGLYPAGTMTVVPSRVMIVREPAAFAAPLAAYSSFQATFVAEPTARIPSAVIKLRRGQAHFLTESIA
ncbi:hypothetical protein [Rhizobium sp. 2YAF20]|uniref:hypothetical protein n=1 Tax=Rhizobium sp. 2YAF20 TaxID=3233027 RepID=UPI003F9AD5EF